MKKIFLLLFFLCLVSIGFSQKAVVQQMSKGDIDNIFTTGINNQFSIDFPIWKAFRVSDNTGLYFIALTEKSSSITSNGDTLHDAIKAFCLQQQKDSLIKKWVITDFVQKDPMQGFVESSIWFWTKYTSFDDIDGDGVADPIVIYGTNGQNGYDDGRIKFIIYFKNKKIAIRHQNGVLDDERQTQVDATFYTLPLSIQQAVQKKMKLMVANGHAIFPYGWEKAMTKKKTFFSERNE
ncbi:MAG: hypothetical protein J0I41_15415 [Filimonas sp.]|nr:hypothetical protein [Filimonas sp.]